MKKFTVRSQNKAFSRVRMHLAFCVWVVLLLLHLSEANLERQNYQSAEFPHFYPTVITAIETVKAFQTQQDIGSTFPSSSAPTCVKPVDTSVDQHDDNTKGSVKVSEVYYE